MRFEYLAGDGSDRVFARIKQGNGSSCLAVLPNNAHPRGMAEARSYYLIGRYLFDRGVPVPELFGYDEKTGVILAEDLGDLLLHGFIKQYSISSPVVLQRYRQAVEALVKLQLAGSDGFTTDYCWDTLRYDKQVMVEKESNYFLSAFCEGYLGLDVFDSALKKEFQQLAERASQEPADFILHRDFQSRNLMVDGDRIRIIDFQGARFGPLGYDLASLLMDPYAGLNANQQQELLDYYCTLIGRQIPFEPQRFREGYYYLFLQRNLQILGAFAFLSKQKGKVLFKEFIKPAAVSLRSHLEKMQGAEFPALQLLTEKIIIHLETSSTP